MLRMPVLGARLSMSTLVATVMMATLVVGPFYLSRALGLDADLVGLVLSVGPLVAALTGVPAGRSVDRFGAQRITIVGLIAMAALTWASQRFLGSSIIQQVMGAMSTFYTNVPDRPTPSFHPAW